MNESCLTISSGNYKINLNGIRCFLANFSLTLAEIEFGYITMAFLAIIIFLTFFGGIKEHYRWFILNQIFWDLSLSYKYICNNYAKYFLHGPSSLRLTCFYHNFVNQDIKAFFDYSIDTNSYSALLLFSSIRFLAIYFPMFYKKFMATKKQIFLIIFIFNFFMISTTTYPFFIRLYNNRISYLENECLNQNISKVLCDTTKNDAQLVIYLILSNILSFFTFLKSSISLLLSFGAAFLILLHLYKQFKNKQKNLSGSFRIFLVILLQTFINFLVFILEIFKNLPLFLQNTFNLRFLTSLSSDAYKETCKNCINLILPLWLDGDFGLSHLPVIQTFIQIRILFEAFIIIFIMSGYRESFGYFIPLS